MLLDVFVTPADDGLDEGSFTGLLASVTFGFTSLVVAEEGRIRLEVSRLEVEAAVVVEVEVLSFLLGLGAAAVGRLREADGCGLLLVGEIFVAGVPVFPFASGLSGCSLEVAALSVPVMPSADGSSGLASS